MKFNRLNIKEKIEIASFFIQFCTRLDSRRIELIGFTRVSNPEYEKELDDQIDEYYKKLLCEIFKIKPIEDFNVLDSYSCLSEENRVFVYFYVDFLRDAFLYLRTHLLLIEEGGDSYKITKEKEERLEILESEIECRLDNFYKKTKNFYKKIES